MGIQLGGIFYSTITITSRELVRPMPEYQLATEWSTYVEESTTTVQSKPGTISCGPTFLATTPPHPASIAYQVCAVGGRYLS